MGNFLLSGFWRKRNRGLKNEIEIPPMPKYKIYTAILNQTGTNAPVAIVLENNIGNIVWNRLDVGIYNGTLEEGSQFVQNKTTVIFGATESICLLSGGYDEIENIVYIQTKNNFIDNGDDNIYDMLVEIRIYQ